VTPIPGVPDNYRPSAETLEPLLAPLFGRGRAPRCTLAEAIHLCDDLGAASLAVDLRCALYVLTDRAQETLSVAALFREVSARAAREAGQ
jgi:hypothetical protein